LHPKRKYLNRREFALENPWPSNCKHFKSASNGTDARDGFKKAGPKQVILMEESLAKRLLALGGPGSGLRSAANDSIHKRSPKA
jgi:hypothetical protein